MKIPNKISNLKKYKNFFLIPDFYYFSYYKYFSNKKRIIKKIKEKFHNKKIIIRSASFNEDTQTSNAGKFLSIPNISTQDYKKIESSIDLVYQSYKSKSDQYILTQEMIDKSLLSGVIFNRDKQNGLPFTTINYVLGKNTSLVTSGISNGKVIRYLNNYVKKSKNKLINFSLEINKIFPHTPIDVEFCQDQDKKFKIFQIRKLNISNPVIKKKIIIENLKFLKKKLSKQLGKNSLLLGEKTLFSTMSDWNPAEILGLKPKTLGLSLYKEIITNHIWSDSRIELGYSNTRSMPLLHDFAGTPYVDLRLDINSFLPEDLSQSIKEKIYKYYFNKIYKKPYDLHDKVESKLIFTSIDFETKKKIAFAFNRILTKSERNLYFQSLNNLTNKIFKKISLNVNKYKKINILLDNIKKAKIHTINKIYLLVNIAKYDAALPFANLARMAFISVSFINSMCEKKIISNSEKEDFINSINLVTTQMLANKNKMSNKTFLRIYGHLRPDTYDIEQKNYKDGYKYYFGNKIIFKKTTKFNFSVKQKKLINSYLKNNKLSINFKNFITFLKKSIYHRENAKFFYSKVINEIFLELKVLAKRFSIPAKDLSFIDIQDILNLYNNFSDMTKVEIYLKNRIKVNKFNYKINKELNLPDIIKSEKDIFINYGHVKNFTFIGRGSVSGKIIYFRSINDLDKIDNKIVCINRADPGFDFIFTKKIISLVICYGGPNSHMAIRCNELGIPAIIGCGKEIFQAIAESSNLRIDYETKKIVRF